MRHVLLPPCVAVLSLLTLSSCDGWGRRSGDLDDDAADDDADDDGTGDDDTAPDDDSTEVLAPTVNSISCAPQVDPLTILWPGLGSTAFAATVAYSDGTVVTGASVGWSILSGPGGTIDDSGLFMFNTLGGGLVTVQADKEDVAGTCTIQIMLVATDNVTGDAAFGAADTSTAIAMDSCAPTLVYPLTGSVLPATLSPPRFQWTQPGGNNATVVLLESAYTTFSAMTWGTDWTPSDTMWAALVASSGGQPIVARLVGGVWNQGLGQWASAPCVRAQLPTFSTDEFAGLGAIFYWSTTVQGLMRLDVDAPAPVPFLTAAQEGRCIGCHAANLSNPELMAATWDGGDGYLGVVEVDDPSNPVLEPDIRRGNFFALNPDGTRLVRSFQGVLYLDDIINGTTIGTLPTVGHPTHPDWSPDGTRIVYASCLPGNDWYTSGCSIHTLDVLAGDSWGPDVQIVPEGGTNNYYPTWSPDSAWIAFNRSSGLTYDEPTASLWLVSGSGGNPVQLVMANGSGALTNSWPRWAPGVSDHAWITFSSKRAYGTTVDGTAQVWLTRIDLAQAALGLDPSAPPAWLPRQDSATANHSPLWVPRY